MVKEELDIDAMLESGQETEAVVGAETSYKKYFPNDL
jgi:hypothetical protein